MHDRRPVLLGPLQVSGGGLERDPFPTADAPIHEADFDTAFRRSFNTPPVSTHSSYPSVLIRIRPSGAFFHTLFSGQIPSWILALIAISV
jgi:hypothetical protein